MVIVSFCLVIVKLNVRFTFESSVFFDFIVIFVYYFIFCIAFTFMLVQRVHVDHVLVGGVVVVESLMLVC